MHRAPRFPYAGFAPSRAEPRTRTHSRRLEDGLGVCAFRMMVSSLCLVPARGKGKGCPRPVRVRVRHPDRHRHRPPPSCAPPPVEGSRRRRPPPAARRPPLPMPTPTPTPTPMQPAADAAADAACRCRRAAAPPCRRRPGHSARNLGHYFTCRELSFAPELPRSFVAVVTAAASLSASIRSPPAAAAVPPSLRSAVASIPPSAPGVLHHRCTHIAYLWTWTGVLCTGHRTFSTLVRTV